MRQLARIFAGIGTTNRHFVEFGFNAPSFEESSGANTEALWQQGWHGLLLDGTRSNASINLHQSVVHLVGQHKRHFQGTPRAEELRLFVG